MSQLHSSDDSIFFEAALWSQKMREEDAFDAVAFHEWLSANPLHGEALADIEVACELLRKGRDTPDVLALRHQARQSSRVARSRFNASGIVSRRVLAGAIAASVAIAAGVGWRMLFSEVRYETRIGEQRLVRLSDGSTVNLDTSSVVRVVYGNNKRSVVLVAGRAHFEVAKDHSRPFSVQVDDKTVEATGTAFTIDRLDQHTTVTLVEGKIRIGINSGQKVQWMTSALEPGEQAMLTRGSGVLKIAKLDDLEGATGWRSGMLTFDDEPLKNVIARMNTYSEVKVVVHESELAEMRISGSFPATQNEVFVKALENYYSVRSRREGGQILLERRREPR